MSRAFCQSRSCRYDISAEQRSEWHLSACRRILDARFRCCKMDNPQVQRNLGQWEWLAGYVLSRDIDTPSVTLMPVKLDV